MQKHVGIAFFTTSPSREQRIETGSPGVVWVKKTPTVDRFLLRALQMVAALGIVRRVSPDKQFYLTA